MISTVTFPTMPLVRVVLERAVFLRPALYPLFLAIPLALSSPAAALDKTLSVLVVRGGHAYDTPAFEDMCRSLPGIKCALVLTAHFERMSAKEIDSKYDAILFLNQNKKYTTSAWNRKRYMDLAELGTGMMFLHFTLSSEPEWDEYHDLVGGKWFLKKFEQDKSKYSTYFTDLTLRIEVLDQNHPTTEDLSAFTLTDAFYGNIFVSSNVKPLLGSKHSKITSTIAWTHRYENSKVVYLMPGFTEKAYTNPNYKQFVANSLRYVSKTIHCEKPEHKK